MPTREAIVDNIIPKQVEKPIPTVMVNTKPQRLEPKIAGQPITSTVPGAEASAPMTEESVRLSPQLSALARKEQAFRQREQAFKDREQAFADKIAEAEKFTQLKAKMSAKDYSEAEALGLSYEEYTKYVLEKNDGEDPVQAKIQALEAKIESLEKGTEESVVQQFEETVQEYKKEIARVVSENPEFSSIKELGREDAVLQLILDTFEEDEEELTVNEASKFVEEKLLEFGNKFSSLPKLKTKAEVKEEVEPQRVLPRPMVGQTLTNDMTTTSEKRPYKSLQHLSEAERYAEARRRVLERREKGK